MRRGKTTFLRLAIVIVGFAVLILCIFWLPGLARSAAEMNPEYAHLKYPVLLGVYTTAIPFYIALFQTLKLLSCIESKNAFSELAVESLRRIKHCAIAIILLYVLGLMCLAFQNAFHPSIAIVGAIVVFASSTVALFAAVLQELLINALEIKSENDLTV